MFLMVMIQKNDQLLIVSQNNWAAVIVLRLSLIVAIKYNIDFLFLDEILFIRDYKDNSPQYLKNKLQ